ncbi:Putative diguanylate cyclase/phosphodiesterase (GGDEF & EAL domains) with PAS/PAC sensor(s) [Thiobacillus denitrificans ATCC 25259]|uniref:Putative diguanylate cyclase/phosphodiesterase (GGDEF & EAL domains) with PAS/PAC sensor(S) n=1 Tax=Thiobacillus denitrificans (strain ATCC 25259 / T1) TaxID=292415 RepID=Q3SG75_THIDA|nr:EAL domain-containing protein [Thiobacillus denitrificans]AAZ98381.1 Putative diguanylate cyclase/phosphodiesterase (GGDEF & EAL domains) with PAS/PAC sensor(s) [Thiobacillus denitrificans ATCC 25259]
MRLVLLVLLSLCGPWATAAAPTPVFVLHAYSQEYPWTRGQHAGFVAALDADRARAYSLSVEYLDSKRAAYTPEYASLVADHLREKYRGYQPAAIYVTDDNALSFARAHLGSVFPGAPVFFSGVNDANVRAQLDPVKITGVFEDKAIGPNLRLMREFDPGARDIVVVGDASETYRAIEDEIKQALRAYPDIRATFISASRIDDVVARLRTRRERFVFLTTLGAFTGADGGTQTLPETVAAIVGAGRFFVFSMEDAYLYPGVLGGFVTSGPSQGHSAAELLIRHLDGMAMRALPPIERSPNEYLLDAAELRKAGLVLPRALRDDVRLINAAPTFYEANRPVILGSLFVAVVLLLISLVLLLLLFARKNRQIALASRQLGETKDSLDRAQRIAQMGNWDWYIAENRLFWSEGIYRLFGLRQGQFEASYEAFLVRVYPSDRAAVDAAVQRALNTGAPYALDHRIVRPDGSVRVVHETGEVLLDALGKPSRMIGTVQDVTHWREAEQALREKDAHLEHVAYHDPLTDLPNRALLLDRLRAAVSRNGRTGGRLAVVFIDLDRFKTINDSLGHAVGDAVLQAAASRLRSLTRDGDTLARLGGDEFVLLLDGLRDNAAAGAVAEKIITALERMLHVGSYPLHISASIGISLYPEDGRDAEALLRHADAAMYKSKERGRNTFHFYEHGITERAMRRLQLESRLRRAFDDRTLQVHYQPLVRLDTGHICGAEALLRWNDPEAGAIPPDHFIALAEDTGLIVPIGEWVVGEACEALKRWETEILLPADFALHVNLSGKQLLQKDLPTRLSDAFTRAGVSPARVVLELTESSIMESEATGVAVMTALREFGVEIAIDDFGTGHSSLSRLKLLPISELKIDRSFIRDIAVDSDDAAIVQAILALSAKLGLGVIAEGVEHAEQEAFLMQHGCLRAQGYRYARPMPEDELIRLLVDAPSLALRETVDTD